MGHLLLMAVVGAVAQFIDGTTGMAYGISSATLMTLAGVAPQAISASVHLAELPTALLSGLSHWRFSNVHPGLALAVAVPGALGAWMGATLLFSLPADLARPYVSGLLFALGAYMLARFRRSAGGPGEGSPVPPASPPPAGSPEGEGRNLPLPSRRPTGPTALLGGPAARTALAFAAGFADALGGGGWGPMMTSGLVVTGTLGPRLAVGTVDLAELLVALAASAAFLARGALEAADIRWVVALVAGGSVAAPLAAWCVSRVAPRMLGLVVGGMVMVTHAPTLFQALGVPPGLRAALVALVALAWASVTAGAWLRPRGLRLQRAGAVTGAGQARPAPGASSRGPVAGRPSGGYSEARIR